MSSASATGVGPRAVVLVGPSGVGKSTVGRTLALRLGWAFVEGDDAHPPANVAKLTAGMPLSDADREPWLTDLAGQLQRHLARDDSVVLACSALKAWYRRVLAAGDPRVQFVELVAGRDELARRLRVRTDHFFDPELLDDQLATVEELNRPDQVDATRPVAEVVDRILALLGAVER